MCQESQTELGIRYPCSNKEHPPPTKKPQTKTKQPRQKDGFSSVARRRKVESNISEGRKEKIE